MLLPTLAMSVSPALPNAKCIATAAIATRNYPGADAIPTTNSLTLPAGKAVEAEGQKVIISGYILDSACVPVPNAQIELWQNDPHGRWLLATKGDLVSAGPVFAGAGRTVTSNDGKFYFVTLFPAQVDGQAPNLNIRIKAPDLKEFSTVLYFAGDQRNLNDKFFKKLSPPAQESIGIRMSQQADGTLLGKIKIALPGKIPYREY